MNIPKVAAYINFIQQGLNAKHTKVLVPIAAVISFDEGCDNSRYNYFFKPKDINMIHVPVLCIGRCLLVNMADHFTGTSLVPNTAATVTTGGVPGQNALLYTDIIIGIV